MKRPISILVALFALALAAAANAQTFTGTVLGGQELYTFQSAATGQYEIVLTWDEPSVFLVGSLFCRTSPGNEVLWGLTTGNRDRVATLNTGIARRQTCFVLVEASRGAFAADYQISFQTTTNVDVRPRLVTDPAEAASVKAAARRVREGLDLLRAAADAAADTTATADAVAAKDVGVPTKETVLQTINPGAGQTFEVPVNFDGQLKVSAMWNRADTDLRATVSCVAGTATQAWGIAESGRERSLRFDADVLRGTTCRVSFTSPRTMVYAAAIELYTDSGLTAQ